MCDLSEDFKFKPRNAIIEEFLSESKIRRITLIMPRDDLLLKGKIYKKAYDSMIYDEVLKNIILECIS